MNLTLALQFLRSKSEVALSQEWEGWLTWNERGLSWSFITLTVTMTFEWPCWSECIYQMVIGVTSDFGVISTHLVIPSAQRSCWGGILVSLRLSVRPSVRPSHIPCPLCSAYSFGWIHFIFVHLIKQLQKVCRVWSFLQNFKICIFDNFLKFVTLTLSCFDLGSDVNH